MNKMSAIKEFVRNDIEQLKRYSLQELMSLALHIKKERRPQSFSLCSIINAKSGKCSEDCRFCVQSAHYQTDAPVYPFKNIDEIIQAAAQAKEIGAGHFSLVTSGKGPLVKDIPSIVKAIAAISEKVGIKVCASLGIMGREDFLLLKGAGLVRYHHNLESSREFFPEICRTHTYDERIETIQAAQEAGLEVCAGGIIGLGESESDRLSMAFSLKECKVDSVPLNILIPLPGTPLSETPPLSIAEILRTIAQFRIIHQDIPIRIAAGRETALNDFLGSAFMAGADGMMIGGYLTQRGRTPDLDHRLVEEMRKIWMA